VVDDRTWPRQVVPILEHYPRRWKVFPTGSDSYFPEGILVIPPDCDRIRDLFIN
jgi:hypothetical protein